MAAALAARLVGPAKLVAWLATIGSAVVCDDPASAQPLPDAGSVDELVVTARRLPELPEDVPIAITAVSGEALERLQATDMASLGKVAPSLVMVRTGAFTQPYLRGVGKRSTLGVENAVATYVDGVYLASSISALLDLRGIERVEIIDGPQGTLFGRNSIGGVIQVLTRNPQREESAEAELHVGSYGYVRGDGYLTGGSDRLAANLAVSLSRNGGYDANLFSGKSDQGEVGHSLVARSKVVWRPAEPVRVTLAADYQDIDQDFSQRPVSGFLPIGGPSVLDFRIGDQDASNRYRFRYGGASVRADAGIGDLTFMSLTAVRGMHAHYATDLDQGPRPLLSAEAVARQDQLSQELQLQSSASAPVRWVAGLYYIHIEEQYAPTRFDFGREYSAQRGGLVRQTLSDTGRVSSYAGYGQATVPIGERTRLTGGLRYTVENRSVRAQGERLFDNPPFVRPIPGLPLPEQEPFRSSRTFREVSWRLSLDRDLSDRVMGWLSASRGFQSGGWNLQSPQSPSFAPEGLVAYEAGLKYLDRSGRIRADASAFYYDYSDLQVSAFTPLGSVTTNAASAGIYGVDAQVTAQLAASTDVAFGAQLLEARFDSFPNATCTDYSPDAATPYAPVVCDVSGNRLPFAPRLKVNVAANHSISIGRNGAVLLSGALAFNSGYFSEADNVVRQAAFATLDLSAEWRPAPRGPSVRLWALNVTNSRYYDSLVTFPTTGVLQRPAAPRRLGVSIGYVF